MKQIVLISFSLLFSFILEAQSPVKWSYSAIKTDAGLFEIHMTAIIEAGWHIYAQQQPEEAIAVPTSILFTQNPVLIFQGTVKELGHKEHFKDTELGIAAFQYAEKIDFIQQVKLKTKGKTNVRGSISYQVCTDEKCLPPATTTFTISLED